MTPRQPARTGQNQNITTVNQVDGRIPMIMRPMILAPIIFLAVTLVLGLVGKDLAFVREDIMMIDLFKTYPLNVARIFTDGWTGLYGNAFPWVDWAYRPIEMMIDWGLVNTFGANEALQIFFKSAIIGLCIMLVYLLVMELTQKPFTAILAAVLSAFSMPVILESWWFHHVVGYTEVVILIGLLSYLHYRRHRKLRWLGVFWGCSVVAPLLGEYGISLPLIVLGVSVIESLLARKPDLKLQISAAVFLLIALFPQFLPNLILKQQIVLTTMANRFVMGVALKQLGLLGGVLPATPYFLIIGALSPILTLVAFLALLRQFYAKYREYANYITIGVVLLCILAFIFIRVYPPPMLLWGDIELVPMEIRHLLIVLLPLGFVFLSCLLIKTFTYRLLAVWFTISYLPFIRLHHLPVNLIPALVPWIILMVLWINTLADGVDLNHIRHIFQKTHAGKAVAPVILMLVLAIGTAAQLSDIAIARETWGKAVENTREMGIYAAKNLRQGSIILGEQYGLFEALDVGYYSQGNVKGNLAVWNDYMWWPLKQVRNDELPTILANNSDYPDKYFLIQNRIPQVLYAYLRDNPENFELVQRFNVQSRVLLIDPLYLILPKSLPYFSGFNIVRIYPDGGGPFYAEFTGDYALYRYTRIQVLSVK